MNVILTDPEREVIQAFLTNGGYESLEDWALDSDYTCEKDDEVEWSWFDEDGNEVDIVAAIYGAMEASGFLEEYDS